MVVEACLQHSAMSGCNTEGSTYSLSLALEESLDEDELELEEEDELEELLLEDELEELVRWRGGRFSRPGITPAGVGGGLGNPKKAEAGVFLAAMFLASSLLWLA